ncbi:hypothetical protein ACER0C_010704 [Sarotherodon galilaeus]
MNATAAEPAEGSKPAPPKFKQKGSRQFKSKAPKPGQKGFDNDVPGMEELGGECDYYVYCEAVLCLNLMPGFYFSYLADSAVVCPWEAFGDMELSDLAQFGVV